MLEDLLKCGLIIRLTLTQGLFVRDVKEKDVQRQLLEGEGVTFANDGCVNMKKCRWDGIQI